MSRLREKYKDEMRLECPGFLCEQCGRPAKYTKEIESSTGDIPLDIPIFFCESCAKQMYQEHVREVHETCEYYGENIPTFEEFLKLEKIDEL